MSQPTPASAGPPDPLPIEARLIEAREGYGLGRSWEAWKKRALAR